MKPFDLQAAKAGAPIVTRDGRPAKFIAHVAEAHPNQRLSVHCKARLEYAWSE